MKSTQTPWTHTGVLRNDLATSVHGYDVMVPAGTLCRKLEGPGECWKAADISFLKDKNSMLYHDATYYGIDVPEARLGDILPVGMSREQLAQQVLALNQDKKATIDLAVENGADKVDRGNNQSPVAFLRGAVVDGKEVSRVLSSLAEIAYAENAIRVSKEVSAHQYSATDMRADIRGRLIADNAKSLEDAELERVFGRVVAPEFCICEARKARLAGITIEEIRGSLEVGSSEKNDASLYDALAKAGIPMLNHATDLYVAVTPESTAVLAQFPNNKKNATTFNSNIDGVQMYDVPFAYVPGWAKLLGKTGLGNLHPVAEGQHMGKVVDIGNEVVVQNVGRGKVVAHDLAKLEPTPNVGQVVDVKYAQGQGKVTVIEQGKGGVER